VTANPYAPPTGPLGSGTDPTVPKSLARRLSFALAATGFAGFWGGGTGLTAYAASHGVTSDVGLTYGVIVLMAISVHLVGVAIVFAAPRGRRLMPALLNGVSLVIMMAITVWGYLAAPVA
jgi:hypothetical protein